MVFCNTALTIGIAGCEFGIVGFAQQASKNKIESRTIGYYVNITVRSEPTSYCVGINEWSFATETSRATQRYRFGRSCSRYTTGYTTATLSSTVTCKRNVFHYKRRKIRIICRTIYLEQFAKRIFLWVLQSLSDSYVTVSPIRQTLNDSTPGLPTIQQPIMSMEDDDMSDQEVVSIVIFFFFFFFFYTNRYWVSFFCLAFHFGLARLMKWL